MLKLSKKPPRLWALVLVGATLLVVAASGPIINTTIFTRTLLLSPDAGTARGYLGVSTTAASATNQSLWTPTLHGGTLDGVEGIEGIILGPTVGGGVFTNATNYGPVVTGGTFTSPTNNYPVVVGGSFTNATNSGVWTFDQGGATATIQSNIPAITQLRGGMQNSDQVIGSAVSADYAEFTNYYGYAGPLQGIVDEPQFWRAAMPVPVIMVNSWVSNGTNVTQAEVTNMVNVATNYGLDYVVIDDGWAEPTRNGSGNLVWDTSKFPDQAGMINWIHGLGLKVGLYLSWGATNSGVDSGYLGNPGTDIGHINQDVNTFRTWDVDLTKLDTWTTADITPLLVLTENHDFAYAIEHCIGAYAPYPPVDSGLFGRMALLQTVTDAHNYYANYDAAPFNLNIAEPNSKPSGAGSVTNCILLWLSQSYADWSISPGHYMEGRGFDGTETLNAATNYLSFDAIFSAPFNVGTNIGLATNIIANTLWRSVFKDPAVNPPQLIAREFQNNTTNGWFVFVKPLGDTNAGSTSNLVMLVDNDTVPDSMTVNYSSIWAEQAGSGYSIPVTVQDVWSQDYLVTNQDLNGSFTVTVQPNTVRLFIFNELKNTSLEQYTSTPRAWINGTVVSSGPAAAFKIGDQTDPPLTEPAWSLRCVSGLVELVDSGSMFWSLDTSGNQSLPSGALSVHGTLTITNGVASLDDTTNALPTGGWTNNTGVTQIVYLQSANANPVLYDAAGQVECPGMFYNNSAWVPYRVQPGGYIIGTGLVGKIHAW